MFKINILDMYKALFVFIWFSLQEGEDYDETLSPLYWYWWTCSRYVDQASFKDNLGVFQMFLSPIVRIYVFPSRGKWWDPK
jgi:hypothetical protein